MDDDADLFEANENEGEIFSDNDAPDYDDDAGDDEANGAALSKVPAKVKHQKKKVTNPRHSLNAARLCGPRGIIAIRDHFKGFKFHGKGHEAADLNEIMRRYEHWAHRMFPKYHFDDVINTAERLGTKKEVQGYMNRYRCGLLDQELAEARDRADTSGEDAADRGDEGNRLNQPLDPLDSMLDEQIALSRGRTAFGNTSGVGNLSLDNTFDAVRKDSTGETATTPPKSPALSEELRAKIDANRLKALELRKARLQALKGQTEGRPTEPGIEAPSADSEAR
ncbi:protein TIPIN homolog [Anopheles bellator]|uniref:protein TIPIN homolog n=1 Tax=Anopheles bellator TaxID=139047 RepID=UPI002648B1CF|nr:protein TIPIN homolog [Anopheles bellator]